MKDFLGDELFEELAAICRDNPLVADRDAAFRVRGGSSFYGSLNLPSQIAQMPESVKKGRSEKRGKCRKKGKTEKMRKGKDEEIESENVVGSQPSSSMCELSNVESCLGEWFFLCFGEFVFFFESWFCSLG